MLSLFLEKRRSDGLENIGASAFAFSGLTSFEFPSGMTTIGAHALESCQNLNSVIIPDSVTIISERAF